MIIGLAVGAAALMAAVRYGPGTPVGLDLLARAVSGTRVGDVGYLRVTGLAGDPWSALSAARVEIADKTGVWLSADRVSVRWAAGDLLRRRVRVEDARAALITIARQPRLLPSEPASPSPVSVRIDRLNAHVAMIPQFALRRGDYLMEATLDVARDNAVNGWLRASSLLHPGDFLRVGVEIGPKTINVEAHALEAVGGALGGSLGLDPSVPFVLDARAHGTPQAGSFALTSTVGTAVPASANGVWRPSGGEASGRLDLAASRWLAPWRLGLGPTADLRIAATRLTTGLYRASVEGRSANVTATASGDVDIEGMRTGPAGVTVGLAVKDLAVLSGIGGLGGGRLGGTLTGDQKDWAIVGDGSVDHIVQTAYTLARADVTYRLETNGADLSLTAKAQGVSGGGGGIVAVLLGATPQAATRIVRLADGRVLVRELSVRGAAMDVTAKGSRGLFGDLAFIGNARIRKLAAAAGGPAGTVLADWRATQKTDSAPWLFALHATGQGIAAGSQTADAVFGGKPVLTADGRLGAAGLTVDHARLSGRGGALTAAGVVSPKGELRLKVGWTGHGALVFGPVVASGPSSASGAITGDLHAPRLGATASLQALDVTGYPALRLRGGRLALDLAADVQGLNGQFGFNAQDAHGLAHGSTGFRFGKGEIALDKIDISAVGATVRGAVDVAAGRLSRSDLTLAVGPGAFLRAGHANGRLQVSGEGDAARAKVTLTGTGMLFPDGTAAVRGVSLTADGPLRALPYRIDGHGDVAGVAGRLAGSGRLSVDPRQLAATFAGSARIDATDVRTLEPAELTLRPSSSAATLHLAVGKGRADVQLTRDGGGVKGHAVVAGFDLGLLDPDIQGHGDGVLDVRTAGGDLVGSVQAKVSGLSGRDADPGDDMAGTLEATFGGGVIDARTALTGQKGARVSAEARLPAVLTANPFRLELESRRPITGRFSADGAVAPLWDLIEGGGRSLSGHLTAEGAISGTLADPRLTGVAALDNGDFEDAAVGLRLKGVTVKAAMKGDAIDIGRFTATDGAKGSVTGRGRLSLLREGASGFRIDLKGFRLIDNRLAQATASGSIVVDRAADGKVRLSGALNVDRAQISPTPPTPSGVVPMEVVEIHRPGEIATTLPPPVAREPPVALDIALRAPGGIFIKGRGLNLEMSLDARVTGSTTAPNLGGVARVVRGDYDFAGKRFQIEDTGVVRLGATLDAVRLNITATREDPSLTARIKIGGTAETPTLTLSSTPSLPQDEILSQVLFGSSAAQLSGLQAAQLASAVAGLAGSGGFDVVGGLRSFAHLDRLAIDSAAATGFSVAGGKYVTDKLYVEVSGGGRSGEGAQVEWRVRKHLAIVSRVTSQGDHAVSVRWRKDY